jgi:hypothetical protein
MSSSARFPRAASNPYLLAFRKVAVMRLILNIIGVVLILMGGVWFLQGINILPGSFMTGQLQWAIYGGIALILGVILLVYANRRKSPPAGGG